MGSNKIQELKRARLLNGSVGKTLISLAIPMGFGLVTIFLFNIVDTFYVGQLGAKPLAAMGFTFPVTYIVMSVAMGFSVGASSTISRAIGEGQQDRVQRLTTDVVGLSVLIVTLFAMIGLLSLRRIFSLMGADDETLKLIADYMIPWFLGVGLLGIPIVSNGAIRATGDTKSPAVIMATAGTSKHCVGSVSYIWHRSVSTARTSWRGIGKRDFLEPNIRCNNLDFGEAGEDDWIPSIRCKADP